MAARTIIAALGLTASAGLALPPSRCLVEIEVIDTGFNAEIFDMSADGSVVVGQTRTQSNSGPVRAFRWTPANGVQFLQIPGGFIEDPARGVSSDGGTIVGANGSWAFVWRGRNDFFEIIAPGVTRAANRDGTVAVGVAPVSNPRAFRWVEGLISILQPPERTHAWDVSDDGDIVAGATGVGSETRAARWVDGKGWHNLEPLPGADENTSTAFRISRDGELVIGRVNDTVNGESEVFLWTESGGSVSLGDLAPAGQYNSIPAGISDNGDTIVGSQRDLGAFLWTSADGMRLLRDVLADDYATDLSDIDIGGPANISADGTIIVMTGRLDSLNHSVGLLIRIPPDCPADFTTAGNPSDPLYGVPDGIVDSNDFFFYLDAFSADNELADITGDGYCRPNGVIDSDDFFLYLDLFVFGCRP